MANYGHPHGRLVATNDLLPFAIKARRVLDAHAGNHEGIKRATEELQRALTEAVDRDERLSRDFSPRSQSAVDRNVVAHFARLSRQGVTPVDILTMVCAVALLDQTEARRFVDTRPYQFAIARAVLGLVPHGGRPFGANTLASIGAYLTERYAALAGVVVRAVLDAEGREATRRAAMTVPISQP